MSGIHESRIFGFNCQFLLLFFGGGYSYLKMIWIAIMGVNTNLDVPK